MLGCRAIGKHAGQQGMQGWHLTAKAFDGVVEVVLGLNPVTQQLDCLLEVGLCLEGAVSRRTRATCTTQLKSAAVWAGLPGMAQPR